jgi:hypothetical protein
VRDEAIAIVTLATVAELGAAISRRAANDQPVDLAWVRATCDTSARALVERLDACLPLDGGDLLVVAQHAFFSLMAATVSAAAAVAVKRGE